MSGKAKIAIDGEMGKIPEVRDKTWDYVVSSLKAAGWYSITMWLWDKDSLRVEDSVSEIAMTVRVRSVRDAPAAVKRCADRFRSIQNGDANLRLARKIEERDRKQKKARPLNRQPDYSPTVRYAVEPRDPKTGMLIVVAEPGDPRLPKGMPPEEWRNGKATAQKIGEHYYYYYMNPEHLVGAAVGWETICQYYDSINWYWRQVT